MNKQNLASRAKAMSVSLVLAVLLVVGMEANAQDRIFSIDAFEAAGAQAQVQTQAARMGTMTAGRTAQAESTDTEVTNPVETFRNLYYNIQPAVYYNADGVNDAAGGGSPAVVYVVPAALSRLAADASRDFTNVRLLVVDGRETALPSSLADRFPSLEFLLFKNNVESPDLNVGTTGSLIPSSFWNTHPNAVAIYNNLGSEQ